MSALTTTPANHPTDFGAKAIRENPNRVLSLSRATVQAGDTPAAIERLDQLEKSFSHLIQKARLALSKAHALQQEQPGLDRTSSKVIEAIHRRIGKESLDIESIAKELNMSKRTLQRRLGRHQTRYAHLRDQIRFHYAIQLLMDGHKNMEEISDYLAFSDRTSFTNAFKRWTHLSPSAFRKTVRDYT